jgi:hypothetical protein
MITQVSLATTILLIGVVLGLTLSPVFAPVIQACL